MTTNYPEFLIEAAQAIYDKKGFNILVLDVKDVSSMTDYFIIAEGNVDRHVIAISKSLEEELAKTGHTALHVEGQQEGDWVVLDYIDFIVHLFTPDMREKYAIEELWKKGKIVDVPFVISDKQTSPLPFKGYSSSI